jgi:hypothetical protein
VLGSAAISGGGTIPGDGGGGGGASTAGVIGSVRGVGSRRRAASARLDARRLESREHVDAVRSACDPSRIPGRFH